MAQELDFQLLCSTIKFQSSVFRGGTVGGTVGVATLCKQKN
uniref:Uncharacterized protein n=1 Tax=Anguilla anguilla TaxID=7936 RepID=A0A0E9Q1Z8_ANGAN